MPKIIALCHQKGGVGKSTVTICLAEAAADEGLRVLVVDADPQRTTSTWHAVRSQKGRTRDPELIDLEPGSDDLRRALPQAHGYDLVLIDCPPRHGEVQAQALVVADLVLMPCGPTAADAWALGSTLDLVPVVIGDRVTYQDALAAGQGVTTFAPRSKAADEIRALLGEIRRMHHA